MDSFYAPVYVTFTLHNRVPKQLRQFLYFIIYPVGHNNYGNQFIVISRIGTPFSHGI